jgi:small subunit ribosomal protein S7
MTRRMTPTPREVPTDAIHHSRLVTQLTNYVMRDGKKSCAERIVYAALDTLARNTGRDPAEALSAAVAGVTPHVEVRAKRVGGATYQIPVEVPDRRARSLALRWIVQFARQRREHGMVARLAAELADASRGQGGAWRKKEDVYRQAQANKAFAHYR